MIIDAHFLTHYKTLDFAAMMEDENAAIYIIRIWGHCQTQRTLTVPASAITLKSICRYKGEEPEELKLALINSGFLDTIDGDESVLSVHQWGEYNAKLVANWHNGRRGGRPLKKPNDNPRITHAEPNGNPPVTHGNPRITHAEPNDNPTEPTGTQNGDKITHAEPNDNPRITHEEPTETQKALEKIREEKITPSVSPSQDPDGDSAHRILVKGGVGISWEADYRARQAWAMDGSGKKLAIDYEAVAREAVVKAQNEVGGIQNPYTFWRKQCELAAGVFTGRKQASTSGIAECENAKKTRFAGLGGEG